MKRILFVLVSALCVTSAAHAVSVAIVADQAAYLPGQTVNLSIVVDATGAQDVAVFGLFTYDPSILLGGSAEQNPLSSFGGVIGWVLGTQFCGSGTCIAFSQHGYLTPVPVDQPAGFLIATVAFTAGAVGSTELVWSTTVGEAFTFFGLTDAPSTTIQVVPEPATAALLALGLVALGSARRARS